MKKVLAIVLALVMAFGCASLAFAEDATPADAETTVSEEYSFETLFATLKNLFTGDAEIADLWSQVEGLFNNLVDMVKNIGICSSDDVLGAADDLEAKIESLPIIGDIYKAIKNIINTIKEKIKALYAGNRETEVEETEASEAVDTGSTSVGIVAFATVSVAAAAAYVCTKKRD